jgi:hypothetical protein
MHAIYQHPPVGPEVSEEVLHLEPKTTYSPPLVKAEDLNDDWSKMNTPSSPKTPVIN